MKYTLEFKLKCVEEYKKNGRIDFAGENSPSVILRSEKSTANSISKRRYLPFAFTEQGIYMLMTILRGDLAVRQSKTLIRLFKSMPMKEAYSAFGRMPLITKGWDYAVERKEALSFLGFKECEEPLIGHENESFQHYWLVQNKDV